MLVVSDTHWSKPPEEHGLPVDSHDVVVHCGDHVSMEALERLQSPDLHAVRGNADTEELAAELPGRRKFEVDGARFGVVHGHRQRTQRELEYVGLDLDVDVLFHGHSHTPSYTEDAVTTVCPGSPSKPRGGYPASYAEVGVEDEVVSGEIVAVDSGGKLMSFETDLSEATES